MLVVGLFVDVLDKTKAQAAFFLQAQFDGEAVAAFQWGFVVYFGAGEHEVVACLVEVREA